VVPGVNGNNIMKVIKPYVPFKNAHEPGPGMECGVHFCLAYAQGPVKNGLCLLTHSHFCHLNLPNSAVGPTHFIHCLEPPTLSPANKCKAADSVPWGSIRQAIRTEAELEECPSPEGSFLSHQGVHQGNLVRLQHTASTGSTTLM
jgi:hypothetical protein